ncbi:hypothetical protein [Actinomadura roseirufa]|uniref:hypothetical protein n=1 Tax=Actinomadura roseirufa TaxID=2094049 RepID=UPI0010412B34|nr:hypothetical protein [Actinomadura roseirufa]
MAEDPDGDRFAHAVRLLLLIDAAADPLPEAGTPPVSGAVAALRSQGRLQKLDFWLRNPDYLADELLTDYEKDPDKQPALLDLAATILDSDEPEIFSIPMLRFLFGAYEALDRTLALLVAPRLIVVAHRRSADGRRVLLEEYYLTQKGRDLAAQAREMFPMLVWYSERAALVRALADGTGSSVVALRNRQYLQRDYAETPLNETIPGIANRARQRLSRLKVQAAVKADIEEAEELA